MMVDLEAVKNQLKGIPRDPSVSIKGILKKGYQYFIPPVILVFLLAVSNFSESRSVFWAIISIPVVTWIRKDTRMGIKSIIKAAEDGALNALAIVAIIVNCNIISGMISLTGLGLNISDMLVTLSQNSLILLLLLTAIASLIIGMGMPIIVSYLLLAILVGPALSKLGVVPMAGHLFIFFFALLADLTPPVAMGSFIAAGIAGAKPMATAWTACRIGLVLYIIPFYIIYNPVLMLEGSLGQIIEAIFSSVFGIIALSAAIQGYLFRKTTMMERIGLFIASNALIWPGILTDFVGIIILLGISILQKPLLLVNLKNKLLNRQVKDVQP
jgi:TRAP transporter 4TM/12TM fusion protein